MISFGYILSGLYTYNETYNEKESGSILEANPLNFCATDKNVATSVMP